MTWTYNIETDIGKVRRLLSDTNTNDQLLSDEEIQFFLDENDDDLYLAGAAAARSIARQLIRRVNIEAASKGVSLYRKQQAEMFDKLADELEAQSGGGASTLQLVTVPTAAIYDDL